MTHTIIIISTITYVVGLAITQIFILRVMHIGNSRLPHSQKHVMTTRGYLMLLIWPYYWWQSYVALKDSK